ncbi:Molybdopterin converting factor, small subunit [Hahella chejuensis KCTC 2396]|uniref:Molybdopterin converting factor, small subunit n=1 Tax=Hahella chejuensis (strain KCTC 2396) TaxID=349521 RepID=Q2SI98_HAHCH|nr:MoaD/ThiS family protein [Hahella chejuensis]ABC29626.1 Molybdopterin converting factor, small subunit [Hahella chejuensis KCTC 2396]
MSITIHIPTVLRPLTGDQKRIEGGGENVREVIENMESHYPGIQERLMADGKVHRFLNIYVNDDDIRFADNLDTPVRTGDSITILPAVAGGCGDRLG